MVSNVMPLLIRRTALASLLMSHDSPKMFPTIRKEEATERQPATLSCGVASIAFVLPGAPQKRAALCAERDSTPITPARKERIKMTDRKRTTAIQVRVTEQEKRQMERQARRCGLSLSGYLRLVGSGKAAAAFPHQRFRDLYRQVNGLRENLNTQTTEQTAAKLDELAGQILTAYANEDMGPPQSQAALWGEEHPRSGELSTLAPEAMNGA